MDNANDPNDLRARIRLWIAAEIEQIAKPETKRLMARMASKIGGRMFADLMGRWGDATNEGGRSRLLGEAFTEARIALLQLAGADMQFDEVRHPTVYAIRDWIMQKDKQCVPLKTAVWMYKRVGALWHTFDECGREELLDFAILQMATEPEEVPFDPEAHLVKRPGFEYAALPKGAKLVETDRYGGEVSQEFFRSIRGWRANLQVLMMRD